MLWVVGGGVVVVVVVVASVVVVVCAERVVVGDASRMLWLAVGVDVCVVLGRVAAQEMLPPCDAG